MKRTIGFSKQPRRYIVFVPELGVLSEHDDLHEALAACIAEARKPGAGQFEPAVYQQTGTDWQRVDVLPRQFGSAAKYQRR